MLKRDYLIKVLEIPLYLEVTRKKYINNNYLIDKIYSSSKRLILEL